MSAHPSAAGTPVALTIAGSDSGGGAGIQADLKTFSALGVYGTSAITAITAQNPEGVAGIQGIDPPEVAAQVRAVRDYFPVGAAKAGMLFSTEIIEAVAEALDSDPAGGGGHPLPLVVDPVMVATSGAKLLHDDAIDALCRHILPRAALITPNMAEAALLAHRPVATRADLAPAAEAIGARFGVPVLVKGGHLTNSDEALDVLHDGRAPRPVTAPYIPDVHPHGTGCTLSAAIAAYLARGLSLVASVEAGKRYLTQALRASVTVGRGPAMNHAFAPEPLRGRPDGRGGEGDGGSDEPGRA